ncbi:serine hydrolase [Dyella caseinilytica]|uniref:Serine hydrolase n=1 Tax=Dyella caseinilytica TaxID=1849581 RepID=A0ABX7GYC2_9GAMM|nr:serine hydrolase [Dyella caseinilytica]QRN54834.1 serine hydrolase [Dyella caseinilytica]
MASIESCLPYAIAVKNNPQPCRTLQQWMQDLHVPGVSIAVIHNGTIAWAKGYGVARIGGEPVTADTMFQAGSISKAVSAMGTLHLVQQGKLSLDEDINQKLVSWKLPASPIAPGAVVTLRELLTHTSGLSVHGFPGYAAGEPVPTLVQVLNGEKPANTKAVRLESKPDSQWKYSGGGITVMQLLLQDVTQQPFASFMQDTVLSPLGMSHSTFEQPLPADRRSVAATPYDEAGQAVPGGAHTYPEQAAAGLWTTPSDLARFVLEIQQSLQGNANHALDQAMTREMLTPGKGSWGLGIEIGGSRTAPFFDHDGDDAGFEAVMIGYEKGGDGVAIMTNGQNGGVLNMQILRSIAVAYGWPDFQPIVHTAVTLDRRVLSRYAGTYQIGPSEKMVITLEGDQLMSRVGHQTKLALFAQSPTHFFTLMGGEFDFPVQADGIVVHNDDGDYHGKRL